MYGKGRDSEAGGDVLVAQEWIGRDPAAKFVRQLAGLLDTGFRHEDDEFVASITSNHIRAAAVLLKNMTYPLQHHVAFEVTVEIVDELEVVEVHKHKRQRAIRAG